MLGRTVLPLLRRQTLRISSRSALAPIQVRGIRDSSHKLPQFDKRLETLRKDGSDPSKKDVYDEPLRPVPISNNENLNVNSDISTSSPSGPAAPRVSPKTRDYQSVQADTRSERDAATSKETGTEAEVDFTPQQPLPDLTQGIPSTFEKEFNQRSSQGESSPESLNITEDNPEPQRSDPRGGAGDGLPRSAYVSSSDRRRSKLLRYFYSSSVIGLLLYGLYQGRDWDTPEEAAEHKEAPDGYTPGAMYTRAKARFGSSMTYYTDPVTKKLLPDAHMLDPNMPPFTLVLGLEDLLIKSEWTREHGWRIAKRPGLDYFLKYLSMYYELVIFSSQPMFTVDQIHRKLDPYQMIYPLFREMTTYEDGGYVKDLSYLNRDLKKVIIIDTEAHAVKKQPENAIVLPPWDGNPNDRTLVDFIPFLEYLANIGFQDTREVLKSFEGQYIPVEFDRRQKLIRQKFEAEQAEKRKSHPRRVAGGLSSFFGTKHQTPDGSQTLTEAEAQGKTIFDQIRERGRENYARLEAHLQREGPKIIAEREAFEKKAMEENMANMKSGMFGWFGGAGGATAAAGGNKEGSA